MVGFVRFLYKHYGGFTAYHIAIFLAPEDFFRRVISDKNFEFGIF